MFRTKHPPLFKKKRRQKFEEKEIILCKICNENPIKYTKDWKEAFCWQCARKRKSG